MGVGVVGRTGHARDPGSALQSHRSVGGPDAAESDHRPVPHQLRGSYRSLYDSMTAS